MTQATALAHGMIISHVESYHVPSSSLPGEIAQVSSRGVMYPGVIVKGVNASGHMYQGKIVPGLMSYIQMIRNEPTYEYCSSYICLRYTAALDALTTFVLDTRPPWMHRLNIS